MHKIKIGIVGYGNLGKAVEDMSYSNFLDYELVAIFSRRSNIITSPYKTKIEPMENMKDYENKIDIMIMCGGSSNDLLTQSPESLKLFNIIDSFDAHPETQKHKNRLQKIAKQHNHYAIYSCGWDPGIMSLMRLLFTRISLGEPTYCFWGKGVSQGHGQAARSVNGVVDAVQYTLPNKIAIKKTLKGSKLDKNTVFHSRLVYVVKDDKTPKNEIINNIKSIPNYYKNQNVKIKFVSQNHLDKFHKKLLHNGKTINSSFDCDNHFLLNFSLSTSSNPHFTAKIMLAYCVVIQHMISTNSTKRSAKKPNKTSANTLSSNNQIVTKPSKINSKNNQPSNTNSKSTQNYLNNNNYSNDTTHTLKPIYPYGAYSILELPLSFLSPLSTTETNNDYL